MSNTVSFTAGPSSADPVSGISTLVEDPFGSSITGSLLPLPGVTSYRLATPTDHLSISLELRGATAPAANVFESIVVNGATTLFAADATTSVVSATRTWTWTTSGAALVTGQAASVTLFSCTPDDFNCACTFTSNFQTLAQLRLRMLIQVGYAASAANPPAGIVAECNEYLYTSQKQLYDKYKALHTERFYSWAMVPGQRYYGLSANNDNCCAVTLDPAKITWVGFEDLNQAWYQLISGINPLWYTRANIQTGWPTRYEIRSCIELFPAPQAAYTLWIKGHLGLAPFVADGDQPTIDDELVLLYAVANHKSAKGKSDAARAMNQATSRLKDLTAANHVLRRYVPGTTTDSPATPPRFLPLNGAPP